MIFVKIDQFWAKNKFTWAMTSLIYVIDTSLMYMLNIFDKNNKITKNIFPHLTLRYIYT